MDRTEKKRTYQNFFCSPVPIDSINDHPHSVKKARSVMLTAEPIQPMRFEHPGVLFCKQCNVALPDFESFRSHYNSHLEQTIFLGKASSHKSQASICPYCGTHFPTTQDVLQHMEVHFKLLGREFECQSCYKAFNFPEELQKHLLEKHTQHVYRCTLCREYFESQAAIQVHYALKHCSEQQQLMCSACPTLGPFHAENEFTQHIKSVHFSSMSAASSPSVSIESDKVKEEISGNKPCIYDSITIDDDKIEEIIIKEEDVYENISRNECENFGIFIKTEYE